MVMYLDQSVIVISGGTLNSGYTLIQTATTFTLLTIISMIMDHGWMYM